MDHSVSQDWPLAPDGSLAVLGAFALFWDGATMSDANSPASNRLELLVVYARLALAASFLAAVADRLGFYGAAGTRGVAWGDMQHFQAYARQLNPWFPLSVIPILSWLVTVTETLVGMCLIAGFQIRLVSLVAGALLFAFAVGMTAGTGVRSALYASVPSASACAFLLWLRQPDRYTIDHLISLPPASSVTPFARSIHYAAAAWAVLFAAPHLWWALGVPAGMPGGRASHELLMTTWRYYFDLGVIGLSILAAFVAIAPIRAWGRAIPRWVLRTMAWIACVMLGLRGIAGLVADGISDPIWWPMFLAGAILFGAIAVRLMRE
jgi:uncharacterized membrane protein YphA (DoxX/SURF4 family)